MSSLLTKAEVSTATGITEASLPADILTWAEARVEQKLGKIYSEKSKTEEFYLWTTQSYIELKHHNILAVSELSIEDIDDALLESDDDFKLFKEEGIIYSAQFVILKTITIKYTYGSCAVGDLDKYLHLLLILKMLFLSYPDIITKTEIQEKVGDYTVRYNVADLKAHPELLDNEIDKVIIEAADTEKPFLFI